MIKPGNRKPLRTDLSGHYPTCLGLLLTGVIQPRNTSVAGVAPTQNGSSSPTATTALARRGACPGLQGA
ncbi:MAG: hypothetical protein PVI97_15170 [Candidatus Thiodiazotropha sp.]